MATNQNFPLVSTQVAFATDPFDTSKSQLWTDVSDRIQSFDASAGRQYELDTVSAGEATINLYDPDEACNPGNPNSPYAPGVQVYRRITDQAMWPPTPVNGDVNILNPNTGTDPSFESLPVGSAPPYPFQVHGITFVVDNHTAHSGSNCIVGQIIGGGGLQAAVWNFSCISGQTYTVSAWFRQTVINTIAIWINGHGDLSASGTSGQYVRLTGTFTADQPTLQLWVGSHSPGTSGELRIDDVQIEPVDPLNANSDFENGLTGWPNVGSGGIAQASTEWAVKGSQSCKLTPAGGVNIYIEAAPVPAIGGNQYFISGWFHSKNGTGSHNVAVKINWYDVNGTYISTSGSQDTPLAAGETRLVSQIITAPTGVGVAFAGVHGGVFSTPDPSNIVYIDRLVITNFGAASTFTPYGPTVYNTFGGFVERWPSTWNYHGTYGISQMTCVDALAPMANQTLYTEYRNSLMAKGPAYYWPLDEGEGATSFAEASGNGGPSLVRTNSTAFGAADNFQAGTQTAIPGDPGGVGLTDYESDQTNFPTYNNTSPIQTGLNSPLGINLVFDAAPVHLVITFWAVHTGNIQISGLAGYGATLSDLISHNFMAVGVLNDNGVPQLAGVCEQIIQGALTGSANATVTDNWADGKWHHYLVTFDITSIMLTNIYVDGQNIGFNSGSMTGLQFPINLSTVQVAGFINPQGAVFGDAPSWPKAAFAHVAIFNRQLSLGEIQDLARAGLGYPGERSDARIARYLSYHYVAPSTLETGASLMGVSNLQANTALLDACQSVALTENGVLLVDPANSGQIWFQARSHRYLETSPKWIFGESGWLNPISDSFQRSVTGGWGTSPNGQIWSTVGGSQSDYNVASGVATQQHTTVNSLHSCFMPIGTSDMDITVDVTLPIGQAVGGSVTQWVYGRVSDPNNYYIARLDLGTDASVSLTLSKRVGGSLQAISGTSALQVGTAHQAGDVWRIRFQVTSSTLRARAWIPATQPQPTTWLTGTDTDLATGTQMGLASRLESGNTNTLPITVSWDSLTVVPGGGEIPYKEDITYDFDPTQVYNDVQVVNDGGATVVGGTMTQVVASQKSYGKRSFQRTVNLQSDQEAQDQANWLFFSHQAPEQRISQLTIEPSSNPYIWDAALGMRPGDRATVKRRTPVGLLQADFFIERIEHSRDNSGTWTVQVQMSPAGNAFNLQPWILQDNTFGALESTTLLGY